MPTTCVSARVWPGITKRVFGDRAGQRQQRVQRHATRRPCLGEQLRGFRTHHRIRGAHGAERMFRDALPHGRRLDQQRGRHAKHIPGAIDEGQPRPLPVVRQLRGYVAVVSTVGWHLNIPVQFPAHGDERAQAAPLADARTVRGRVNDAGKFPKTVGEVSPSGRSATLRSAPSSRPCSSQSVRKEEPAPSCTTSTVHVWAGARPPPGGMLSSIALMLQSRGSQTKPPTVDAPKDQCTSSATLSTSHV